MNVTNRQRRAFWSIGLLAVAAAAASALVYGRMTKNNAGGIEQLGSALPGFAVRAADITQYLITTPEGAYRLTKGDARWVLMERGGYPASMQQIQALAAGLVNLKLQRVLTRDPKKFDALRLSAPSQGGTGTLIQATDAQGMERASLLIGHAADDLLLRHPGDDVAYVASGALPPLTNPAVFADLDALRMNASRIQRVEIVYASGSSVKLERRKPDESFLLAPNQRSVPGGLDQTSNAELAAVALSLIPFRPIDVAEDDGDRSIGQDMGQRRITTFDGLNIQMRISKHDDNVWATVSAGGGGSSSEAVAINSRTSGWTFAFPTNSAERLFPGLTEAARTMAEAPALKSRTSPAGQDPELEAAEAQ